MIQSQETTKFDLLGESDDDRREATRVIESSASGMIDQEKKLQLARKKRKRFVEKIFLAFLIKPIESFRVFFICVSMCKYECVRRAAKRLNFREVSDEDDWNVYWTDTSVGIERVAQMKKWQVRDLHVNRKVDLLFFFLDRKLIIFRE